MRRSHPACQRLCRSTGQTRHQLRSALPRPLPGPGNASTATRREARRSKERHEAARCCLQLASMSRTDARQCNMIIDGEHISWLWRPSPAHHMRMPHVAHAAQVCRVHESQSFPLSTRPVLLYERLQRGGRSSLMGWGPYAVVLNARLQAVGEIVGSPDQRVRHSSLWQRRDKLVALTAQ